MAVTFILGRAGSGKTHACVAGVRAALAEPDSERRLVLLVPEQASFQVERTLALGAPGRGLWRAEVLSFSRLARHVLSATGAPELLGPQARRLALRHVTRARGDALVVLRRAARTQGFFAELDRLIEELIRENVTPDQLRAAAQRVPDQRWAAKAGEVAELYDAYLAWLGPRRCDEAARLALLRERLAQLAWLPTASIWVDGFAGFTGQEAATLAALARHARHLYIALLLDPHAPCVIDPRRPPDPVGLFHRTETTYQTLLRLFTAEEVAVTPPVLLADHPAPRFRAAPRLAALEGALATPLGTADPPPPPPPGARVPAEVRIVRCATHRAELRAAARWIRATIAESAGTLRFRDFAVIARDLGPLAETVAEVFGEFEIPYFLDRRRPMRAHPLARLVPALFDAVRTNLGLAAAVRLLRTRLLPIARDAAEQLENLVVRYGFAGLRTWQQPEWPVERGATDPAFAEARAAVASALAPLCELARQDPPPSGAAWAQAVFVALEALGVRRTVDSWRRAAGADGDHEAAELHRLAWDALAGVLQDIHTVLADTRLAAGELADIVGGALRELTLGLAPPTLDQVLVGSIERSRHPDLQFAWLLAFNEGIFPARPASDAVLTAAERDALAAAGLPAPAAHRDDAFGERLLAYIACSRPARALTISFAAMSDDGAELQPSPLLADVRAALPDLDVTEDEAWPPPTTLNELAEGLLAARADTRHARHRRRHERLLAAARMDAAAAARLDRLLRGLRYANDAGPVVLHPGGDGSPPTFSPSQLETYIQCPFRYFAGHALRLDAQRGPHPLRWDLGTLAHELLATIVQAALRRGDVTSLSDEVWDELTAAAVAEYRRTQPPDLPERRPDFAFLGDVLLTRLRDVVQVHTGRWRRGEFRPRGCEEWFGDGPRATRPPIAVRLADGRAVRIRGKIDRLDVAATPNGPLLLIYDYKSGSVGPLRQPFLTGARLQLFTYLLAWRGAPAAEGRMGGVLLAPLYPNLKALEKAAGDGLPPEEQLMHAYKPRGLVTAEAAFLLDANLGGAPSPVAQLRRRQDGELYANSDAVTPERLAAYAQLAEETVRQAAEQLLAGTISIAPLVEKDRLACGTCDFRDVCRFDRAFNRPRAAEAALPQLADAADAEDDE